MEDVAALGEQYSLFVSSPQLVNPQRCTVAQVTMEEYMKISTMDKKGLLWITSNIAQAFNNNKQT